MIHIRPETEHDYERIDCINRQAFNGEEEVQIVRGLRKDGHIVTSLVAEKENEVVGHCMFSHMHIGDHKAIALGPVAVTTEQQRQGIGTKLIQHGLEQCKEQGHERVIVLGHPEYYPRFGFKKELTKNIAHSFPPDAFMALELIPGSMNRIQGKAIYAPPFGIE